MKKSWLALSLPGLFGMGLLLPSLTLGSEIEPGFDLFETPLTGTSVDIGTMTVNLTGNPTPLIPENLGRNQWTDTMVQRKQGINPFEQNDSDSVDIELVVLSLKSIDPFDLGDPSLPFGLPPGTMVDLYVVVNALDLPSLPTTNGLVQPSTGTMTVHHEYPDGGTHPVYGGKVEGSFHSVFSNQIHAFLIFVNVGGELSNPADWVHSMPADPIDLESDGWWSHTRPKDDVHNMNYPAGKFYIVSPGKDPITEKPMPKIVHKGPHPPRPTDRGPHVDGSPVIFDQPFSAILINDNKVSLSWVTGYEENMAGFAAYRGVAIDGDCGNNQTSNFTDVTPLAWKWSGDGDPTASGLKYSVEISDDNGNNGFCYGLLSTGYDGTWELYTVAVQ